MPRPGKWSSGREALRKAIKPGDRVFFSLASGEPRTLLQIMAKDYEYYRNVEILNGIILSEHPLAKKGFDASFQCISFQNNTSMKVDYNEGRIDFLPIRYSDFSRVYSRRGTKPIDVVIIQLASPWSDGRFSLGASASLSYPAALNARTVVAEINEQAPRTYGPCSLSVNEIDFLIECSAPLVPYSEGQFNEVEQSIAKNVAELIPDGATIQIGIGNIPSAILHELKNKNDLGIHSGMLSDGMVELVERGVITNKKKNIYTGKLIAGELIGTNKLFNFSHENPSVEIHPASVTHNSKLIGEIDNFIAINSALEVDLTGQINAEHVNGTQISSVGGQFDFVDGAYFSNGGKSIIALTSTAAKGRISRIVPVLPFGTPVTLPRYMTDIVITEHGVAQLKGKSNRQRAEALISIAHPDHQEQLRSTYRKMIC